MGRGCPRSLALAIVKWSMAASKRCWSWALTRRLTAPAPRAALAKLDFLVVQDIFLSETASLADVVLPAASTFIEADGTFTNLEGRVQRSLAGNHHTGGRGQIRHSLAPGAILAAAQREKREEKKGKDKAAKTRHRTGFDFDSLAAILLEIARAIPAYAEIRWDGLGAAGKQTSVNRKANRKFQAVELKTSGGDNAYPLPSIMRGTRLFDGAHLLQLTKKVAQLAPAPFVGLNTADALALGLARATRRW